MILYPALDLKNGNCVRLLRGEMSSAKTFNSMPAQQALEFQEKGCEWLHVVDLDGAVTGKSRNSESIIQILRTVKIPIQLGGGIRTMNAIEKWVSEGISRVVLGTIAAQDPNFMREAAREFPEKIAIGMDARKGKLAINGWIENTELKAIDVAKKIQDSGVVAIIYTDIDQDGSMRGLNISETQAIADATSIPVIASGGIASFADIKALKNAPMTLNGVIAGRAIYEKKIDIQETLKLLRD